MSRKSVFLLAKFDDLGWNWNMTLVGPSTRPVLDSAAGPAYSFGVKLARYPPRHQKADPSPEGTSLWTVVASSGR